MTFTLSFEIDPDVTHRDVALALRRAAALIDKTKGTFEEGDKQPLRDPLGQKIGEWNIE
jgi:hypothetical protein